MSDSENAGSGTPQATDGSWMDMIDPGERAHRVFRSEVVILEADLRRDVSDALMHTTMGEEDIHLENREVFLHAGQYSIVRGSRFRQVGSYERVIDNKDIAAVGEKVEEYVNGPVEVRMQVESESIVGGAYLNVIGGVYTRLAAWSDFMAWGGWLEGDLSRVEISGTAIRSYCLYAHTAGARIARASSFCDDFVLRTENFGMLVDNTATESNVGMPGAGDTLET